MKEIMQLGSVSWVGTVIVGILAGWLAGSVTGSRHGLIINLVIGLVGSFVGFYAARAAGINLHEIFHGWFWGNLIVSAAGASVLLIILRMFGGTR